MDENEYLLKNVLDKVRKSVKENSIEYSYFLTLSEKFFLSNELEKHKNLDFFYYFYPSENLSERTFLLVAPFSFADKEIADFIEENKIISYIKITPKSLKYAQKITHRDILGTLMSLGYERKMFGDIFLNANSYFVTLFTSISNDVISSITKIKNTFVNVDFCDAKDIIFERKTIIKKIQLSSIRLDAIISHAFNLNREDSKKAILDGLVKVNDKFITSPSFSPKNNSYISLKGKGKFIFKTTNELSKKGKNLAELELFS